MTEPQGALPGSTRFIVLMDWENLALKREDQLRLVSGLQEALGQDRIRIFRAFASDFDQAEAPLRQLGVEPIVEPRLRPGKNISDMALVSHAFAEAVQDVTHGVRSTFVIVSGDSDFYLVARALRAQRFGVVGVVRDPSGGGGFEQWYDLVIPTGAIVRADDGERAQHGAATALLQELNIPALSARDRRRLAGAAVLCEAGPEAAFAQQLSLGTGLGLKRVSAWLQLASVRGPILRKKGQLQVPEGQTGEALHRVVEDRLLRRLKRHPDAVGLRAALRERLGFADRERTAEAVVDALRNEQGAIDAGVLRARLRDEFDVEPWLLGFGRVAGFYRWLQESGVVVTSREGSRVVVALAQGDEA